jgi:DNA-binding MarR family transcriptional regulator
MAEIPVNPPTSALLQIAYNSLARRIFQFVAAGGFSDLRPSHGNVLEHLSYVDGQRLNELAARAGMTPQSMGELVDDLERRGYVERHADPADRRAKRVHLTEKGRATRAVAARAVTEMEGRLEALLGQATYAQLRATLTEIIEAHARNEQP